MGSRTYAHVQAPRCVELSRAVSSQPRDSPSVCVAHRDNVQSRVGQFIFVSGHTIGPKDS